MISLSEFVNRRVSRGPLTTGTMFQLFKSMIPNDPDSLKAVVTERSATEVTHTASVIIDGVLARITATIPTNVNAGRCSLEVALHEAGKSVRWRSITVNSVTNSTSYDCSLYLGENFPKLNAWLASTFAAFTAFQELVAVNQVFSAEVFENTSYFSDVSKFSKLINLKANLVADRRGVKVYVVDDEPRRLKFYGGVVVQAGPKATPEDIVLTRQETLNALIADINAEYRYPGVLTEYEDVDYLIARHASSDRFLFFKKINGLPVFIGVDSVNAHRVGHLELDRFAPVTKWCSVERKKAVTRFEVTKALTGV